MYSFSRSRRISILMALLYIVLGVLFIVFPGVIGSVFCWVLASITLLLALTRYWSFYRAYKAGESGFGALTLAVILTIFGIFCLVRSDLIISFLPMVLGIVLLVDGLGKLPVALSTFSSGRGPRIFSGIASLIPLILGIILIFNPFEAAKAVIIFFGISMAVDGVLDLTSLISMIRKEKLEQDYKDIP